MWNIMNIPMLVTKWSPYVEEVQPAMNSIPLWVTLNNIPPSMFTDKGLEFLASAVGKPLRLHPKTKACASFDEAQILMEADLTKELPSNYLFTGEEEGEMDVTIKYSYLWLPPRCSSCKKWGHLSNSCLTIATINIKEKQSSVPKQVQVEESASHSSTFISTAPTSVEIGSSKIYEPNDSNVSAVSDEEQLEVKENEEGWITPSKSGHASEMKHEGLKYGEVSLLSNSYAALSDNGEDLREDPRDESNLVDVEEPGKDDEAPKGDDHSKQSVDLQGPGIRQRGSRDVPPRPFLPRGTKSTHKSTQNNSTLSVRDQCDQKKKNFHTTH